MKIIVLFSALALLSLSLSFSQPCFPDGIIFNNQTEIDNFEANYPECTQVGGDVCIQGSDIVNLNGLCVLTSIGGNLEITGTALSSLAGLSNLQSVSKIHIHNNESLFTLSGLEKIISLQCLQVSNNNVLICMCGLNNLTQVSGDLKIGYNNLLISLSGFENLTYCAGDLKIVENGSLTNLSGLNNLSEINGDLSLVKNNSLSSLNGLDNLTQIGGNLEIQGNQFLADLSGISNLSTIEQQLSICNNNAILSLSGLENLEPGTINELSIWGNNSLSDCDVQFLTNYLVSPTGSVNIFNNAEGCNNPGEIASVAGFYLPSLPYGNYIFYYQSDIDDFEINYPGFDSLNGLVNIVGPTINNLNGLNELNIINGDLVIGGYHYNFSHNPNLKMLTGLDNLTTINGNLRIAGNDSLVSVLGLNSLTTVQGDVIMGHFLDQPNPMLEHFPGLSNLEYIGGALKVDRNYKLSSLNDFVRLNHIGGSLVVGTCYETLPHGNPSLKSISGLHNITSIGGDIKIQCNDSLTSLLGLQNISSETIQSLDIWVNNILSSCDVASICDYIVSPNGEVNIYSNGPGCNSQEEIEIACGIEPCLSDGIIFYSQSQIDSFQLNNPGCSYIQGNVIINGDDIHDLSGLGQVKYIGDTLRIGKWWSQGEPLANPNLYDLSGLENLIKIGGNLEIVSNKNLKNLNGLNNLSIISGSLIIGSCYNTWTVGNDSLKSLNGLENLNSIGGDLRIAGCTSLENLTGLENLQQVSGNLYVRFNSALLDLTGFDNLNSIQGKLYIYNNGSIQNLSGLEALHTLGGGLIVESNNILQNIEALTNIHAIGGDLWIENNHNMKTLKGLENIDPASIDELLIINNSSLDSCSLQNICNYLESSSGIVDVFNNATGCSSIEEIQEFCDIFIDELTTTINFTLSPNPVLSSVAVNFSLTHPTGVYLKILDLEARVVLDMANEFKLQGEQTLVFDISYLRSGIYFISLKTNYGICTKKLIKL